MNKLTDSETKLPSFLQRIATLDLMRQLKTSSFPANITVSSGCVLNAKRGDLLIESWDKVINSMYTEVAFLSNEYPTNSTLESIFYKVHLNRTKINLQSIPRMISGELRRPIPL